MSKLEENNFTWDSLETVKLPKFPNKCMDNYSIISFPEEAYYLASDQISKPNSIFADVEYPGSPRYFIDPTVLLIKKKELVVKPDVYSLENKQI